jgi:hypothetical protein
MGCFPAIPEREGWKEKEAYQVEDKWNPTEFTNLSSRLSSGTSGSSLTPWPLGREERSCQIYPKAPP